MKKIIFTLCLLLVSGLQAKEFEIIQAFEPVNGVQSALALDRSSPYSLKTVVVENTTIAKQKIMKLYDGLVVDIKTPIVIDLFTYETKNKQTKTVPVLVDREAFIQFIKDNKEHFKTLKVQMIKESKKEIKDADLKRLIKATLADLHSGQSLWGKVISDLERRLKEAQPYR